MKTMTQVFSPELDWLTEEQKVMTTHWLSNDAEVYIEGPYMCSFHKKEYGYVWISAGKRLLKLDGRGYNVKMSCEIHPVIKG